MLINYYSFYGQTHYYQPIRRLRPFNFHPMPALTNSPTCNNLFQFPFIPPAFIKTSLNPEMTPFPPSFPRPYPVIPISRICNNNLRNFNHGNVSVIQYRQDDDKRRSGIVLYRWACDGIRSAVVTREYERGLNALPLMRLNVERRERISSGEGVVEFVFARCIGSWISV